MQHTLAISIFLVFLASAPAFSGDQHGHELNHDAVQGTHQAGKQTMKFNEGIAKKIDQKNGKVTLQHGDITSVNMPAMTMNYRVKDVLQLKSLNAGDKVRFSMEKINNDYVVTHIELVKE